MLLLMYDAFDTQSYKLCNNINTLTDTTLFILRRPHGNVGFRKIVIASFLYNEGWLTINS